MCVICWEDGWDIWVCPEENKNKGKEIINDKTETLIF